MENKKNKPPRFLNLPRIHGGKEALKEFIKSELVYPPLALQKRVQGDVIVKYKISDNGEVLDPHIVKGLGYGCDEEALRLVKLIRYDAVKNRGVRVTANTRIKIPFRITSPKIQMTYTPKKAANTPKEPNPSKEKSSPETYHYTIRF
ncbi:MAG: energy transducer TonB [Bacteroidales bacterium]